MIPLRISYMIPAIQRVLETAPGPPWLMVCPTASDVCREPGFWSGDDAGLPALSKNVTIKPGLCEASGWIASSLPPSGYPN